MSTPAVTPDLSDFKQDAPDLSDFKADAPAPAQQQAAQPSFLQRAYNRVSDNISKPLEVGKYIGDALFDSDSQAHKEMAAAIQKPLDFHQGLMRTVQSLPPVAAVQSWMKDPANAVGDLATMGIAHAATSSPTAGAVSDTRVPSGLWGQGKYGTPVDQWGRTVPSPPTPEPGAPRIPLWQKAGTPPTAPGFDWQGSTPEEVQDYLGKLAARFANKPKPQASAMPDPTNMSTAERTQAIQQSVPPEQRAAFLEQMKKVVANRPILNVEKAPGVTPQESPYQVVTIPAGKMAKPVGDPYHPTLINPPMEAATSSTVDLHGYDPASRTMKVQFKNGNVYQVKGVPQEIFDGYKNAESQGSFYQQNIKGRYDTALVGRVGKTAGSQVRSALTGAKP